MVASSGYFGPVPATRFCSFVIICLFQACCKVQVKLECCSRHFWCSAQCWRSSLVSLWQAGYIRLSPSGLVFTVSSLWGAQLSCLFRACCNIQFKMFFFFSRNFCTRTIKDAFLYYWVTNAFEFKFLACALLATKLKLHKELTPW